MEVYQRGDNLEHPRLKLGMHQLKVVVLLQALIPMVTMEAM